MTGPFRVLAWAHGAGPHWSALRRLLKRPVAVVAISYLLLLIASCIAAPWVAPDNPQAQNLNIVLSGPTLHHLLGTDTLGRDVLSRLIYGGRRSLLSVAEGLAVVLALGVPLGLAAGYGGRWADRSLSRAAELIMAIPPIIFVLVVLAVVPENENAAMIVFGILGAPAMLRVVRGATLAVREELYITAARLSGLSPLQVVRRHIVPRVTGPIIVQASLFAAYALLFETGLAFLGLTADPTAPTWGGMVAEASTVIEQQEWLLIPSGTVIALTILAFGLLGDAVRDATVVTADPVPVKRPVRRVRAKSRTAPDRSTGPAAEAAHAAQAAALLSVRGLSVAAVAPEGPVLVIDSVSFDVFPGEALGLVGESGCGKTVTALALLRLLPAALDPAGGQAAWAGRDLLALTDRAFDELRGSAIGYVAQEPQASLDPSATIGRQLAEVARRHDGLSRRLARQRAVELLRQVDFPDPEQGARAYPHELSGGMAQRAAIALALAGRPRLLIADEPTTALDVTVQAELLALLRRLQRETGMAILLITHDWGVVADICNRAVVMYAGQIVEQAGSQDLFDRPLHPYSRALMRSHPSLARHGQPIAALTGRVPPPGEWPAGCRFAPRCALAVAECRAGPVALEGVADDRLARCIRIEDALPAVNA
jgi:peptide/nickel transport system permease protein